MSTAAASAGRPAGLGLLFVVGAASVLSALDLFVVNIAFSSLRASFPDASPQALSWVLSVYSVLYAAVLVPAGRMADRHGRRRVFRAGLWVFGVASLACALAPGVGALIAGRALKGVGAAMMMPTGLGILLAATPRERHTTMMAFWGATGSVAASLGPVLGGALVALSWRAIFFLNVPVVAWALVKSATLDDDAARPTSPRPDLLGSVLLVLGLSALVVALSYASTWRIVSVAFGSTFGGAVVLLGWFLWRCWNHPSPALPLTMFRARPFLAATLGMTVFNAGFAMMLLGGTLFLTTVWHWTPLHAGEGFALGPAMAMLSAIVAGRRAIAPRRLVFAGTALFALASFWWRVALLGTTSWAVGFLPGLVLFGLSAGLAQTGFLATGAASVSAADYATGSGVLNTARQLGAALGVAGFVALAPIATEARHFAPVWVAIGVCALLGASIVGVMGARPSSPTSPS